MDVFGDLHTHTAHSREADNFLIDRLRSYAEAKRKFPNLGIVGILDHDTLNYLEPMYRVRDSIEGLPLLLPGIEITSAFEHPTEKGRLVQTHLLGYFPQLIKEDPGEIRKVNSVLEPTMRRVLTGKLRKNLDIRLQYFFDSGIVPGELDFDELKAEILKKYEKDKKYVESMEPKEGDIINWPLNSSDKMVLDVLLEKGILATHEEGKLYVDRINEDRINRLGEILAEKKSLSQSEALKEAKRLQGICHGDYNDDYYKISTQEAIALVRLAGGIAILAHPMVSIKKFKGDKEDFFSYCANNLIPTGLQGMEAFYPKQEEFFPFILQFCRDHNLYITGGSDDHQDGRNHIGECGSRCPVRLFRGFYK